MARNKRGSNKASKVLRQAIKRLSKTQDATDGGKVAHWSGQINGTWVFCAHGAITRGHVQNQTLAEHAAVVDWHEAAADFICADPERIKLFTRKVLMGPRTTTIEEAIRHHILSAVPEPGGKGGGIIPQLHDSFFSPDENLEVMKLALIKAESREAEERLAKMGLDDHDVVDCIIDTL